MKKSSVAGVICMIIGFIIFFVNYLQHDTAAKDMLAANLSFTTLIGACGIPLCFAALFGVPAGIIFYLLFVKRFFKED